MRRFTTEPLTDKKYEEDAMEGKQAHLNPETFGN
jgi:hypothetical protein